MRNLGLLTSSAYRCLLACLLFGMQEMIPPSHGGQANFAFRQPSMERGAIEPPAEGPRGGSPALPWASGPPPPLWGQVIFMYEYIYIYIYIYFTFTENEYIIVYS